jgi:hypothetical protein
VVDPAQGLLGSGNASDQEGDRLTATLGKRWEKGDAVCKCFSHLLLRSHLHKDGDKIGDGSQ